MRVLVCTLSSRGPVGTDSPCLRTALGSTIAYHVCIVPGSLRWAFACLLFESTYMQVGLALTDEPPAGHPENIRSDCVGFVLTVS